MISRHQIHVYKYFSLTGGNKTGFIVLLLGNFQTIRGEYQNINFSFFGVGMTEW
jgi:hypothetical protein